MQNILQEGKICFVISPIGDENSEVRDRARKVFEDIITPAVEHYGYIARRIDHIAMFLGIPTEIIRHLTTAPLVIADLTDSNPNVFYELGIRHAVGKPFIQIIDKNQTPPFDVRSILCVQFDHNDKNSIDACIRSIRKQIEAIEQGKFVQNEVATILEAQRLSNRNEELERGYNVFAAQVTAVGKQIEQLSDRLPGKNLLEDYREEIKTLKSLKEAGIVGTYRNREIALKEFLPAIDAETSDIAVIGSSMLGLLQREQYKEVAERLKEKSRDEKVRVRFLLTHPAVADLRAEQEQRRFQDIGNEIIESLEILREWSIPPEDIRLYKGTPTIFAIKTRKRMLLNPYAYGVTAFNSPCLIVETGSNSSNLTYFYDEYNKAHFNAWHTSSAEKMNSYEKTIAELKENLGNYTERIREVLQVAV